MYENKSKTLLRYDEFFESLHEEKIIHKQHRVDFVKRKLTFTIGLFSLGSLKEISVGGSDLALSDLLLLVPIVALAFDIYIFSEDFKVKRIGIFMFKECEPSKEEKAWESWLSLPKHRERLALFASVMLTIVVLVASLLVLYAFADPIDTTPKGYFSSNRNNIFWWFLISAGFTGIIFESTTYLRDSLVLPLRNRVSTIYMYIGLLLTFFLTIVIIASYKNSALRWGEYSSPFMTLLYGVSLAVYLFVLLRVIREIIWRLKSKFSSVKFFIKADKKIQEVFLCGEFTRWEVNKIRMDKDKALESFSCEIALEAGKTYEYKFLTYDTNNMDRWEFDMPQKSIDNDGWNSNSILKVKYGEYPRVLHMQKFIRNLYSK